MVLKVEQDLTAIEAVGAVRSTMNTLHSKFANGAENLDDLGGSYWHPRLGLWGHFQNWLRPDGSRRYWNPFGVTPSRLRSNITVEFNPPDRGRDKIMQGVLARSEDGERWLLHRGRMSIAGKGISEIEFDRASGLKRKTVRFANGESTQCHPVTNIDSDASLMQEQLAEFVRICDRVRLYYRVGASTSEKEAEVENAEISSPELMGSYEIGAQDAKVARRHHGVVWHALVAALDDIKVQHTNRRVGRWGPDLRTTNLKPALFEIKVTSSASDLQRAVGQLFLYEKLLSFPHRKVLVMPAQPSGRLEQVVRDLDLEVLTFTKAAQKVKFDGDFLRSFR